MRITIGRPKVKLPKDRYLSNIKFLDISSWINLNQEWAGTREKYILKPHNDGTKYLIKFPEYGENEIYTELFNCYLALNLDIRVASYFPCSYHGKRGIISRSFLDQKSGNTELWEMKDLICQYSGRSELGKKLGRDKDVLQEHDIDNIYMILNEEFGQSVLSYFFEMIGFDCLIGHSDRHWENYGVILSSDSSHSLAYRFAPLYDTATSYLVGWDETKILEVFKSGDLDKENWYRPSSKKNTCRITINGNPRTNHLDLFEYILNNPEYSKYLTSLTRPIMKYNKKIARYLLRNYCTGISSTRADVILKILDMRHKLISEIINRKQKWSN